jgi:hydroxymethylpyrimidine pyrophosphatase-like HAD family hydrolase
MELRKFIKTTIREYLNEEYSTNKSIYQKNIDSINSERCVEERISFPQYLLTEIGIDGILKYLILEDGRTISRDTQIKFKEEPPQRDGEDILDYIRRKSNNIYTWQQIEKKLKYNYSFWLTREIPKDKEFSDLSEALKFSRIFTMKFTHGYIMPLIESYDNKK